MSVDCEIPNEMKSLYIERRKVDIKECLNAFEILNFSFIEKIGHQTLGNAQSFGFDSLTTIARDLEIAAREKNISRLNLILKDFSIAIENLSL